MVDTRAQINLLLYMKKFIITEEEKNYIKNLYEQVSTKIKVPNADVVKQQLGTIDLEKYLKKFNENSSVVERFVTTTFNGQLPTINSKLKQNLPRTWGPVSVDYIGTLSGALNYKVESVKLNSIKLSIMNKGAKEPIKNYAKTVGDVIRYTKDEKPQTKYDILKNKTIDYGRETTLTDLPQRTLDTSVKSYHYPPNPWTVNNSTKRLIIDYQIEGNINVDGTINTTIKNFSVDTKAIGYIAGFINIYDTAVVTVPPPFTNVRMNTLNFSNSVVDALVGINLGDTLSWDGDHYLYADVGILGTYKIVDIPIRNAVKEVFSDKTFDFKTYAKNLFNMVSV